MAVKYTRLDLDAIWPEEITEAKRLVHAGDIIRVQRPPYPKKEGEETDKKRVLVTSIGKHVLFAVEANENGEPYGDCDIQCYQWDDVVRADHERYRLIDHSIY